MATNSTGNSVTKTISMETAMWTDSDARARKLGLRSYSAYIQNLVRQDLQHRQALTITEASSGHSRTAHTAPATSPADAAAEKLFSYRAPRRRPAAASSQKPSSPKRAARSQKDRGRSIP